MVAAVIKNKRSETLFRFKFARRQLQVVQSIQATISDKTKIQAALDSPMPVVAVVQSVNMLKAVVR